MSPASSRPSEQATQRGPPKACRGCSGLQPSAGLVDVEDMGNMGSQRLRRKTNIGQQMLTDVVEQLTKLQSTRRHPQQSQQWLLLLRGLASTRFSFFRLTQQSYRFNDLHNCI